VISIITPSHNCSAFISETIRSVVSQTFTNWEMIIVDDFSSDKSVNVIQSFVDQDSRIRLIRLPENSGAAVARNTAIEAAKGRYIAFLDSDDLWLPNKLEAQIALMQAHAYPFVFSAYDKIDEQGKIFGHIGIPEKVAYSDLLKTCSIGCLTVIYDAAYFGKVYMPTNTKREDFAMWLKLLKMTDYAFGINKTLAQYRVYDNQNSANKIQMAAEGWRVYREVECLSILKATYYFSHYAVRGILRTKMPKLARILGVLK